MQLDPTQADDTALVLEALSLPSQRIAFQLLPPSDDRELRAAVAARDEALELKWTSPTERRRLGHHSTGRALMMGIDATAAEMELRLWKQRAMAELDLEFAPAMWGEVPGR